MEVRRGATFLGIAGLIEYALQLLLPVILVRTLTQQEFGDYRLVWLVATTAIAVFPFAIPLSLFHFLPQSSSDERPRFIGNAWLFLTLSGLLAAVLFIAVWPTLPQSLANLQRYSFLAPAFLALWIMGSLIDVLPTADGNLRWQANAMSGLAIFRTVTLGMTAALSADGTLLLVAMCVFALTKVVLVPLYAVSGKSPPGLAIQKSLLIRQIAYSFPFAVGNALFLLRVQADQWIVATFFSPDVFALISIAATVLAVSSLVRQPLNNATLPRLSRLVGQGDTGAARDLLRKTYATLALLLLPLLGLLLVTANELIEIVYTADYLGAAPMMQVYLLGQMTGVFAAGHLLVILNAGRLSTTISAVCLLLSVVLSLAGVRWFGVTGAVVGSVISLVVGEVWALLAVTRRLRTTVPDIINVSVTGRAVGTALVAVMLALASRQVLPEISNAWLRLVATTASYCFAIVGFGLLTGLHRVALPMLQTLLIRSNRS